MKNSKWIVWGVVVLVVLFAIILATNNKPTETEIVKEDAPVATGTPKVSPNTPVKNPTPVAPVAGMKVSLGGIFEEKGNYQCDYEQVSQQTRSSNVVYISNGKMRGEFRTSTALESTATMVVYDGTYLYVWTEGKSTGTLSQPKTIKDLPGIIPEDVSSGRILGSSSNNVSWNCHAWSVKPSLIAKPTYVSF